jgi:hypothetical protein
MNEFSAWIAGQDASLDWEDHDIAYRQICDALALCEKSAAPHNRFFGNQN